MKMYLHNYFRAINLSNRKSGFGLVTVLSIGMIASLIIAGLLSGILSVHRVLGVDKTGFNVQNSAEASIDYVLSRLNNPDTAADFDAPKTIAVTKNETGISTQLNTTVTISSDFPSNASRIFDPKLSLYDINDSDHDSTKPTQKWSLFANAGKSWRVITSTCSSGTQSKLVVVVAKANYPDWRPPTNMSSATTYFPASALGTNSVTLGDFTGTRGYSSADGSYFTATDAPTKALGGDITAFAQVIVPGKNVEVGGSLTVPSIKAPGNLSADGSANETNLKVNRYVTVNQGESGFNNVAQGDDFSNVFGLASPGFPKLNDSNAYIQTNANQAQSELPPAPIAPRNNDGSFASSVTYSANPTSVVAGDNAVNTLAMSGDGSALPPTRVFVENNVSSDTVVTLNGNINSAGRPSNFQIWYNGSGSINVNADNVNATIYAPFATVNVIGKNTETDKSSHFRGAIVARNLNLSKITFDMDLTTTQNGNNGISSLQFNRSEILKRTKYTAVSYFSKKI